MVEMKIKQSKLKDKRFEATFYKDNKQFKTIHFGLKNPKHGTYIDHGDPIIRKNYIARHEVREKKFYNSPYHAATLSRFILWGNKDNLLESVKQFKKKYTLS